MTPAARLTNEIRNAVSRVGARLFVMVTGRFWSGQVVGRTDSGDLILRNARQVSVGYKGMPDLIGWMPHVVTEADVGKTIAVFCAPEIKAGKDRLREGQPEFIAAVNKAGGRAGVARSVEDALRIVIPEP